MKRPDLTLSYHSRGEPAKSRVEKILRKEDCRYDIDGKLHSVRLIEERVRTRGSPASLAARDDW